MQFDETNKVNSQEFSPSPVQRNVFTYHEYLNLVHNDRFYAPHDYSSNNIAEDQRMIAYFDSMVERDIGSTWMSSSEDESPSYFNYVMPPEFDLDEHLKSIDQDNEDGHEVAFRDISTDSDEKFAIQKRFDFTKSLGSIKMDDDDDYLECVFAKRMHTRYITSFVNNLIDQIEKLNCDKDSTRERPLKRETSDGTSKIDSTSQANEASENAAESSAASDNGSVDNQSTSSSESELDSSNLNQKIKNKKENSLIFFAYKFSKSLLFSLYFGTFYEKSKSKYFQEHLSNSNLLVNSKQTIQTQIKKMSRLNGICKLQCHKPILQFFTCFSQKPL